MLSLFVGSVALSLGPLRSPISVSHVRMMAGFEAKPSLLSGERLSLRIDGPETLIAALPETCRSSAKGVGGIVYEISGKRLEIIAEGEHDDLEAFKKIVEATVQQDAEDAECRSAWQTPVGQSGDFQLVRLSDKMHVKIVLQGPESTLDYYRRHLQIEAVFNRGLKLQQARPKPDQLELDARGDVKRLKSFIRWCYNGPPLDKAHRVTVAFV